MIPVGGVEVDVEWEEDDGDWVGRDDGCQRSDPHLLHLQDKQKKQAKDAHGW